MDVCGIIYEDELIIIKLVSKCSMIFEGMHSVKVLVFCWERFDLNLS